MTRYTQYQHKVEFVPPEVSLEIKHASDILFRLKRIDSSAVLAGGAPRSWFFHDLAIDFDFFFYTHEHDLEIVRASLQKTLGVDVTLKNTYRLTPEEGGILGHPYLRCVYESTYKGKPCQFMYLSRHIDSIVDEFPLNLSRIHFDGESITPTVEFLEGVEHNAVVNVDPTKTCRDKYLTKYLTYFPNFKYYPTTKDFYHSVKP